MKVANRAATSLNCVVADLHSYLSSADRLGPGELVRVLYRLGRGHATGVFALSHREIRVETMVLRRGQWLIAEHDANGRLACARLARLVADDSLFAHFDGGTAMHPPGGGGRQLALALWARTHLEQQVDERSAQLFINELAGARLLVRPEHAPDDAQCDDTDRRILASMTEPRRIDQIWSLARTPRFRLIAFLYFLRAGGSLTTLGVGAVDRPSARGTQPPPLFRAPTSSLDKAHRLLGLTGQPDLETIKRAYRKMARSLHPDLHSDADDLRRRELAQRFAQFSAAYAELIAEW